MTEKSGMVWDHGDNTGFTNSWALFHPDVRFKVPNVDHGKVKSEIFWVKPHFQHTWNSHNLLVCTSSPFSLILRLLQSNIPLFLPLNRQMSPVFGCLIFVELFNPELSRNLSFWTPLNISPKDFKNVQPSFITYIPISSMTQSLQMMVFLLSRNTLPWHAMAHLVRCFPY